MDDLSGVSGPGMNHSSGHFSSLIMLSLMGVVDRLVLVYFRRCYKAVIWRSSFTCMVGT